MGDSLKWNVIALVVVFLVGIGFGSYLTPHTTIIKEYNQTPVVVTEKVYIDEDVSFASINVPAVDQNGQGVVTALNVQVIPGSGKVLTNIDKLLFWVDTQFSIRTSRAVAENITGKNLSKYDIIFTVDAPASVIEGESAGAALTAATIAALEGKKIKDDVMMTGTINHDGTIGLVGEVYSKAVAAKEMGADLFLVPLTQSKWTKWDRKEHCEQIGLGKICTIETIPEKVDISKDVGIEVKEVQNIQDVMDWVLV